LANKSVIINGTQLLLFACNFTDISEILPPMRNLTLHGKIVVLGIISLFITILLLISLGLRQIKQSRAVPFAPSLAKASITNKEPDPVEINYEPVREITSHFRADTHRPTKNEAETSGKRDPELFSPGRDLIFVDDPRVYWESDNDKNDDECDHSMHKSMEKPLRLLIELVHARGGTLEVQDSYRASGVHNTRSLHKEGRAIDITCDELGLEKLASLAWASGFDWVYYEKSSRGGAHVHCSVKRDHSQPTL